MKHLSGIVLVVLCSFLGTAAQILFKISSDHVSSSGNNSIAANYLNLTFILGLISYGLSFVLLTMALEKDDVSTLFPFIGLTFIWVTLVSPMVFPTDSYSVVKFIGIISIAAGVSFIGYGGKNGK